MERADPQMMQAAIEAAGRHQTHPNPRVGAVIVARDGSMVGRAGHPGPGLPHAEVIALQQAGPQAVGSTMYVTLEPCVHHGRTPPCTDALIAAGVGRVVAATGDPDSQVAGRGFEALRRAGIEVMVGMCEEEARRLDPGYFHHRTTGRPRVTLKAALTLDGQVAAADGSSQWITSPQARRDGHCLRAASDGVMVGAGTVLSDDPLLTVRIDGYRNRQPVAVVVAGRRRLSPSARVFSHRAVVLAPELLDLPAEVLVVPDGLGDAVDLPKALEVLGSLDIVDLLVEGGPRLATGLLQAGLVDRGVFYLGARLGGGIGRPVFGGVFAGIGEARDVTITDVRRVGPDVRVEFEKGAD